MITTVIGERISRGASFAGLENHAERAALAKAFSRNPRLRAMLETLQMPGAPAIAFPKEFIALLLLSEEYPHLFENVDLLDVHRRYLESLESGNLTPALAPIVEAQVPGYKRALEVLLGTYDPAEVRTIVRTRPQWYADLQLVHGR
jgi:hypothetical protein